MNSRTSHRVEHINGCTLIFGSVPIEDFVALSKTAGKDAVISPDLASLTGASFAFGLPEDIERLRQSPDLRISESRIRDSFMATGKGLPPSLAEWLKTGERGMSSDAMCKAIFGIPAGAGTDRPHDPDDLSRCIKFLDAACSEGADRLKLVNRMQNVSFEWDFLVGHWQELEESFAAEEGSQKPKTYELMQRLFARPGGTK